MTTTIQEEAPPLEAAEAPTPLRSTEERKEILDRRLSDCAAQGWRIENRSDVQATIAKGKPVNHLLHFLLTIFTLGLWAIVWICMAIFGGVKRRLLSVDEYGYIQDTKI